MNASAFSEPFTPRGVAGFARANYSRLLFAQIVFAALAAAAIAWFFYDGCFPTIQAAITNLPSSGEIRSGQLYWSGDPSLKLAEGRFLAFDVDLDHSGQFLSTSDLQIEFGRDSIRVFSFFGYYTDFFYPQHKILSFNQTDLDPLWKAWRMEILFFIALIAAAALLASWAILAAIYTLPAWLFGFFTNRDLDWFGSWKLACAALLPGALLMTAGVLLYDLGFLSLVALIFVFGAHFVLGWLYLVFALIFFPRVSTATPKGNPFKRKRQPGT